MLVHSFFRCISTKLEYGGSKEEKDTGIWLQKEKAQPVTFVGVYMYSSTYGFFFFALLFFPFALVYLGQGNSRWRKFHCVFLIFIDFFFSLLNTIRKKRFFWYESVLHFKFLKIWMFHIYICMYIIIYNYYYYSYLYRF